MVLVNSEGVSPPSPVIVGVGIAQQVHFDEKSNGAHIRVC